MYFRKDIHTENYTKLLFSSLFFEAFFEIFFCSKISPIQNGFTFSVITFAVHECQAIVCWYEVQCQGEV